MVGLISDPITGNPMAEQFGLNQFTSTTGDVAGATAQEALHDNTLGWLVRENARQIYDQGGAVDEYGRFTPIEQNYKTLSPEEATAQYGIKDAAGKSLLNFDKPIAEPVAQSLNEAKHEKLLRDDILSRAQGGIAQGAVRLGTSLGVSLLDPVNVAAAFIPVVGEARYAAWLANAGSLGGRAAIRAGVGAAQSAVGTAAIQPLEYLKATTEHNDFGMTDALLNVAFGSILGGGLHTAGGLISDIRNPSWKGIATAVDSVSPDAREAALRGSIANLVEGRPVVGGLAIMDELNPRFVDAFPNMVERDFKLLSEEAGLKASDTELAARLEKLPQGDAVAADKLARLETVDRDLANEKLTAAERRDLATRRDELLTDTNPDKLKEAASPIAERRSIESQRQNIATRLADIATERNKSAADAALSPLPKLGGDAPSSRVRLNEEAQKIAEQQKEPYADPQRVAASKAAEERVNSAPKGNDPETQIGQLQKELADHEAMLAQHENAGRLTEADLAEYKAADQNIKDADAQSRAYDAAAACLAAGV